MLPQLKVKPKNTSSNGIGYIKAVYPYQIVIKNIWIGKPNFSFDLEWDEPARRITVRMVGPGGSSIEDQGITNVTWEEISSSGGGFSSGCSGFVCRARGPFNSNNWSVDFKVTAYSSCGTTVQYITAIPPVPPLKNGTAINYDFVRSPNYIYTLNAIANGLSEPLEWEEESRRDISITVYDIIGRYMMETNAMQIDISSFKPGLYILKAAIGSSVITKKVLR